MARPTIFSEELADAICERLAAGESLIRICGGDDFPSDGTVYRWIATIPAFRDKYAQARSVQAERMADEILTIREVAELLKLNEKTAYKLASAGKIPGFKVGGSWRFERQAIASWIKRKVEEQQKGGPA